MKRIEKLYEILKKCGEERTVFALANECCPDQWGIDSCLHKGCKEEVGCSECWMAECGEVNE